jgi:hypothetical protein
MAGKITRHRPKMQENAAESGGGVSRGTHPARLFPAVSCFQAGISGLLPALLCFVPAGSCGERSKAKQEAVRITDRDADCLSPDTGFHS